MARRVAAAAARAAWPGQARPGMCEVGQVGAGDAPDHGGGRQPQALRHPEVPGVRLGGFQEVQDAHVSAGGGGLLAAEPPAGPRMVPAFLHEAQLGPSAQPSLLEQLPRLEAGRALEHALRRLGQRPGLLEACTRRQLGPLPPRLEACRQGGPSCAVSQRAAPRCQSTQPPLLLSRGRRAAKGDEHPPILSPPARAPGAGMDSGGRSEEPSG